MYDIIDGGVFCSKRFGGPGLLPFGFTGYARGVDALGIVYINSCGMI